MALITCPECGHSISDRSTACVHCGFPMCAYTQEWKTTQYEDFEDMKQRTAQTSSQTHSRAVRRAAIQKAKRKRRKRWVCGIIAVAGLFIIIKMASAVLIGINSKRVNDIKDTRLTTESAESEKTINTSHLAEKEEDTVLRDADAIDIAETILRKNTMTSSIFNLRSTKAQVETDGHNHYIVSLLCQYEDRMNTTHNEYATIFFTYFPETEEYESSVMKIKTSDTEMGAFGAITRFKKDDYYGWVDESDTNANEAQQTPQADLPSDEMTTQHLDKATATGITASNFESVVDLTFEAHNDSLFELFLSETMSGELADWEYIGTSYATFSLPEYDFYSFDVYRANSEYYLLPFNDYVSAPNVYEFVENEGLVLRWTGTF